MAVLLLAPGVGLVQALGTGSEVTLRWVHLARAGPLVPQGAPVDLAAVMTVPMRDCGRAARLVARLRAHLRDAALVGRFRAATTRAELVEALAAVEHLAGESPLTSADLLLLLG